MSHGEINGMCHDTEDGRFWWNQEEGNSRQSPKALCCSDRRRRWGHPPIDENLGLDPAAVAPEKRVKSQRWKKNEFGLSLDVVVHRMLSSTCQMVKWKGSEHMSSGEAHGNGATKFPRAMPLSHDPLAALTDTSAAAFRCMSM